MKKNETMVCHAEAIGCDRGDCPPQPVITLTTLPPDDSIVHAAGLANFRKVFKKG